MITIHNDKLVVNISEKGAELQNIIYDNTEVLWQGNPDIWGKRSPLLFPIVGRLIDDKLKFNGKEYPLKKHGFGQKKEFKLIENTDNKAVLMLESDEETKAVYPFDFVLKVTYTVCDNKLTVNFSVLNPGEDNIYFSIGGHPAFNCKIGDYLLFEKNETLNKSLIDNNAYTYGSEPYLNNNNKIVLTDTIFDNDALVFKNTSSKSITLKTDSYDVKLTYNDAPYLGIWAKPKAPYVCIEPWYGVNDSIDANCEFNNKEGIVPLKSKEEFNYTYDVEIIK